MGQLFPFFCLAFLSSLANQFLQFAIPLMIYKSTNSIAWSGIAFFIEWIPRIFAFPLAGTAVDRYGPYKVYLVADFTRLIASGFAFLGILAFPQQTHLFLIALAVLTGFFFEYAFISIEKAVWKLALQPKMHQAQSVLSTIEHLTMLGGPALAGILITFLEPKMLLAITAVIFLLSLFIVARLNINSLHPNTNSESFSLLKDLQVALKTLISIRKLVLMVLLTSISNFMQGISLTITPAMTTEIFGMPDSYLGLVYSVSGILGIIAISSTFWLTNWFKINSIGITAFLISCAAFFCLGIAPSFWIYLTANGVIMAMDSVFTVYIRTERGGLIPLDQFGSTIGIIVLLNFVPLPFAGLLTAGGAGILNLHMMIVLVASVAFILSLPLLKPLLRDDIEVASKEI
jgi:hypothetical protein